MIDQSDKRGRLQFGLRKLMLWTAVVAALLGILQIVGLNALGQAIAALWVAVVAFAHAAFGSIPALVFSQIGGMSLALCLWFVLPIDDATVILLIVLGGAGGLIPFAFVEIARRVVDCIDHLCYRTGRCD